MNITRETTEVKVEKVVTVTEEQEEFVLRLSQQELADLRSLVYIAKVRSGAGSAREARARALWGEIEAVVPARDVLSSWSDAADPF